MIARMSRQNPTKNRSAFLRPCLLWIALCAPVSVAVGVAQAGEEGEPEAPAAGFDKPTSPPEPAVSAPPAAPAAMSAPPAASAPAPVSASASGPASVSASAPVSAPVSGDSLRTLEQRVGELKDQVYRAKARLTLLGERHLKSTAGGGRAVVTQKTQMGRLFAPLRITYQLDGREVFSKGDDKTPLALSPAQNAELAVWDGGLPPGDHTLAVSVVYRGNGTPALSYFNRYTYTASAAQRFRASDGGTTRIRVVCREKGNPALTDLADRPLIEFVVDDGTPSPSAAGGNKVATKAASLGSP